MRFSARRRCGDRLPGQPFSTVQIRFLRVRQVIEDPTGKLARQVTLDDCRIRIEGQSTLVELNCRGMDLTSFWSGASGACPQVVVECIRTLGWSRHLGLGYL